ncbi:hypothetical protein Ancab_002871 [Ancistrocladus abbreviatus]
MKKAELVVIPLPGMGHLIPAVGIAKRLVEHDERISITLLVMNLPFLTNDNKIKSLQADASTNGRITFLLLPELERPMEGNSRAFLQQLITEYKPIVKRVVQERVMSSDSASTCSDSLIQLAGFVVDMFCPAMIDVANELNVPSYVFFTSGAGFLNVTFHFQTLADGHGVEVIDEFKDLDTDHELDLPGFRNRIPASVLPSIFLEKEVFAAILNYTRRYTETKGIMVNTFMELEPHAIQSLLNDAGIPPIYPAGPVVNPSPQTEDPSDGLHGARDSIIQWLDDQPPSSVVFLCFGSMGSFTKEQEIRKKSSNVIVEADAIEKGVRKIMDLESEVRSKVKENSEIFRKTMEKGGSSYDRLGCFIENMFENILSYLE